MNIRVFRNTKIQDFVAGLILQQLLDILIFIFIFPEGYKLMAEGKITERLLWGSMDIILYLICVVCVNWIREKICKADERNVKINRWKYLGAMFVMLLGEVSDGWAIVSVGIFLVLIVMDGQYYRMGSYKMKKYCLPFILLIAVIVAWISFAQYAQFDLWNIQGMSEKIENRLFLMCNVGIAYAMLLFLDTFQKNE